jgi:hypothetical protein
MLEILGADALMDASASNFSHHLHILATQLDAVRECASQQLTCGRGTDKHIPQQVG